MKHNNLKLFWIFLICLSFSITDIIAQGIKKEINVGYLRWQVVDSGDEGEGSMGWGAEGGPTSFWDGYVWPLFQSKAVMLGCKDWTDTLGTLHSEKISGHGQWETDDKHIMMPVPDSEGWTINRYYRYAPVAMVVDGLPIQDFFPQNPSDHVDPGMLPGTADALVESYTNTDMGVTMHQRVIAFSQQNHNKYIIREYVFTNTGNVDLDDEIELPDQVIEDFYFLKQLRTREEGTRPWVSAKGQYPGEDLRIMYGYMTREPDLEYDGLGWPQIENGFGMFWHTTFLGEAILHASRSPQEFDVDDINQPQMTGYQDVDFPSFTFQPKNMSSDQIATLYQVMQEGFENIDPYFWPTIQGAKPGTHHGVPLDELGIPYVTGMPGFGFSASVCYSVGPYTLNPGDSIKIVVADVIGTINPETSYEVGQKWINNEPIDRPPDWDESKLPQQYQDFPELYAPDDERDGDVNLNKDMWILSGLDSLLMNARAAQWAYQNNYNVPQPPRPSSFEVKSLSDGIRIEWGSESEADGDLAGYRIYRARGDYFPNVPEGTTQLLGTWEQVYEGPVSTKAFTDTSAQRSVAYYYAVIAFDDGQSNGTDFNGLEQSLESNPYTRITTSPAYKLSPASPDLSDVVIVPNPFNLSAGDLQFPGEQNKIVFFNLTQKCTIRIFTESGDLIATIDHEGSGDASWGISDETFQATQEAQIVVSGVYIAHIETEDGQTAIRKFLIVR